MYNEPPEREVFLWKKYMKEQSPSKYINHVSGIPIRIPPYLRLEISRGNPDADIQLKAIRNDPYAGKRNPEDTLPANLQENIRLRRIAGKILAPQLANYAEGWGIKRYTVLVHGSLAKGLIRSPSNQDASDIDIDLIIDDPSISKDTRNEVRKRMRLSSHEIKVDSYVWNMTELRRRVGEYSRYYLRSASYPLADKGKLWDEVLWTGIESLRFLELPDLDRKRLRKILSMLTQGQISQASGNIDAKTKIENNIYNYLKQGGLLQENAETVIQKATRLCRLVSVDQPEKMPETDLPAQGIIIIPASERTSFKNYQKVWPR